MTTSTAHHFDHFEHLESTEPLVKLQVLLEQQSVEEARAFYTAKLENATSNIFTGKTGKTNLADLAPGQALVRRAIEPCARHFSAWFWESLSGQATRGVDCATWLYPLFTSGIKAGELPAQLQAQLHAVAMENLTDDAREELSADPDAELFDIIELSDELIREAQYRAIERGALTVAFLAVRQTVAHINDTRTAAILGISDAVRDELEMLAFKAGFKDQVDGDGNPVPLSGTFGFILRELKEGGATLVHKRKVLKSKIRWEGFKIDAPKFERNARVKIGAELLYRVAFVTKWFELEEELAGMAAAGGGLAKLQQRLICTDEFNEVLSQAHDLAAIMAPRFPVMVTKPADWDGVWTGAYVTPPLRSRVPLIKSSNREYLKDLNLNSHKLDGVFKAVNALQSTAFRINEKVYNTMQALWEAKSEWAGLAVQEPKHVPEYSEAEQAAADAYRAWYAAAKSGDADISRKGNADRHAMFCEASPEFACAFEAFRAKSKIRAEAHGFNAHPRRNGDLLETRRVLNIARTLVEADRPFYFPVQLDSRGRAYYVPLFLNPQGGDVSKGLLTFATAKRITENDTVWLAVHGANAWAAKPKDDAWVAAHAPTPETALDKCDYATRYAWVLAHEAEIWASAADPLANTFWAGADSPFAFLAFCIEWAGWMQHGENFESSLPIFADGTCNGIQHWAAALRDEQTAPKVNLVRTARPGDIYANVAQWCIEYLRKEESEMAKFWLPKLNRSLVKQPVMTKGYGATALGQRRMLKSVLTDEKKADKDYAALKGQKSAELDKKGKQKDMQNEALGYLTTLVRDGIAAEAHSTEVGMEWTKIVARTLANQDIPLGWKTPDGFEVWQGYRKTEAVKIHTVLNGELTVPLNRKYAEPSAESGVSLTSLVKARRSTGENHAASIKQSKSEDGRIVTTLQEPTAELNVSKQANAIAPNLVHSWDGTAMRMTVARCFELGITSMACVHDSFGTHVADFALMQQVTREVFVEIHSRDLLAEWFADVMAIVPDEVRKELEAKLVDKFGGLFPARGTLDLSEVLNSPYFFG